MKFLKYLLFEVPLSYYFYYTGFVCCVYYMSELRPNVVLCNCKKTIILGKLKKGISHVASVKNIFQNIFQKYFLFFKIPPKTSLPFSKPGWAFGVLWDRFYYRQGLLFGLIFSGCMVAVFYLLATIILARYPIQNESLKRILNNLFSYQRLPDHKIGDSEDPILHERHNENGSGKGGQPIYIYNTYKTQRVDLHADEITDRDFQSQFFMLAAAGICIYLLFVLRSRINDQRQIRSTCWLSCIVVSCCAPCYMTQAANEYDFDLINCCDQIDDDCEVSTINSLEDSLEGYTDETFRHLSIKHDSLKASGRLAKIKSASSARHASGEVSLHRQEKIDEMEAKGFQTAKSRLTSGNTCTTGDTCENCNENETCSLLSRISIVTIPEETPIPRDSLSDESSLKRPSSLLINISKSPTKSAVRPVILSLGSSLTPGSIVVSSDHFECEKKILKASYSRDSNVIASVEMV